MKFVKMAAIATMALTLFASCNKKDEPKKDISSICIRLNETALRAFEDPIEDGTLSKVTDNVKVIINDGAQKFTLSPADIEAATSPTGWRKAIKVVPTKVTVIANGETDGKNINTFQGLGGFTDPEWDENPINKKGTFDTKIPLYGETTTITKGKDGEVITFTANVEVKPALARLEIAGEIKGQPNSLGENAYSSISVEEVYINNYRTIGGKTGRTYIKANQDLNGFESAVDPLMMDVIDSEYHRFFCQKKLVAGYQLFPETPEELVADPLPKDFYNHVILKVKVSYGEQKGGRINRSAYSETGYVTIRSFMTAATGDLKGFQAGTIYKLDLADLSKYFKTDENLDPENPVTPDPEPDKKALIVTVKAVPWTAKNIKPDIIQK